MLNIETYKPKLFSDLIERIWILENSEKEVELIIPPNQYVNLILPINNSKYNRNQIWIDTPHIEGVSIQNTVLTYPPETKLIGIRFFAFGLYPFIQLQGKNILNNSVNLSLKEQYKSLLDFSINDSDIKSIEKVNKFLNALFREESYQTISLIKEFYSQFRWNNEIYSIEEYCKRKDTNYTTLNRNFTRIIGISTKKFERLIKFRKSLCDLIDSEDNLTAISLNSRYFDQAHFIREFKIFLNQTPSNYKALIKHADKQSKIINYNFKLF